MEIKLNLIIDGNYMLYRNIFSLHRIKTLYGDLDRALEVSVNNHIKKYPFENIYFVSDSKSISWRKKLYSQYKEQRKKDESIDWEFCYNTYEVFKESLKTNTRVKILQADGFEGDDFIHFLTKKSNEKGESNLILASDGDIIQLLDYRLSPSWINIQMKDDAYRPKLYVPEGYKLFLKELRGTKPDLFNMNDNDFFLTYYSELTQKCLVEEVSGEFNLFIKIIMGDSGDNIKAVLHTEQKDGKLRGIGEAGAKQIWNNFKSHYPNTINFKENSWIDAVIPYIIEYKKMELDNVIYEKIKTNIIFNRKLVHFDSIHYPKSILEQVKNLI